MNEGDLLSWSEYWRLYKEGKWQSAVGSRSRRAGAAETVQPALSEQFDLHPDQIRAEEYLRELAEREKSGRDAERQYHHPE